MVTVLYGDAWELARELEPQSIDCVVTSPPYWGLRDYGHDRQFGLESTPQEYVAKLVDLFARLRPALKDGGTVWLNLGDSYTPGGGHTASGISAAVGNTRAEVWIHGYRSSPGLKPKDLCGVPWRVAFALQDDGWVLRSDVVWAKPNPMPESVTDRPTKSHEMIFMFAKATWSGPEPGRFADIADDDARWIAGLVDCEGSIVVKRVRLEGRCDSFGPQVSIGSTCRPLLETVARIVGRGNVLERPGMNAPMYYWQLANGIARDFLLRVYPFLIVKQRQARVAIHTDSLTYYRGGKKPERKQRTERENEVLLSLWERCKSLNHFGTPDLSDVPEPTVGRWNGCARYYFDQEAVREPLATPLHCPGNRPAFGDVLRNDFGTERMSAIWGSPNGRNIRTVWTIATQPYAGAHFAVFPEAIAERCIKAGCPEGGTVLDPFAGSGTTLYVARKLGRNSIGFELNEDYRPLIEDRLKQGVLC